MFTAYEMKLFLFIDMNDRPIIANLPLTQPFRIEENEEVGKTLYHVLVRDLDTTDTHLIQGIYTPESGSTYFSLSAGKWFQLKRVFISLE